MSSLRCYISRTEVCVRREVGVPTRPDVHGLADDPLAGYVALLRHAIHRRKEGRTLEVETRIGNMPVVALDNVCSSAPE